MDEFCYLLDFSCGALEQFDVASTNTLPVFGKGFACLFLVREEDEGVPCGPAVSLVDKQDALLAVQNLHGHFSILEELELQ